MKRTIVEILSFLFVLLFSYAALTKLFDLEKFTVQVGQSPLLTGMGTFIPWVVIGSELLLVSLFGFARYRLLAFYGALGLMTVFTAYIIILLQFSTYIPCSCGGILEQLGWHEHLIFNFIFLGMALLGVFLQASLRKEYTGLQPYLLLRLSIRPKIIVLTTVGVLILSTGIVVFLYALSTDIRKQPGSFLRAYPPHPVLERASMDIAASGYYLAGATHDMVYLANRHTPLHVLGVRSALDDTVHISLRLRNIDKQRYFRIQVVVDSPYFYFADGSIPFLYRGTTADWTGTNILPDTLYFSDLVPLSSSSFALRALHSSSKGHVIAKRMLASRAPQIGHDLLERQGDGIFSTDGMLQYNRTSNKLIYMYYYRNAYFVADTLLRLGYRGNTIDTFSTVRITFDTVRSEKSIKLSAPPMVINHCFTTYREWIFVHSTVAAHNENKKRFEEGSVIDVYDFETGTYSFSFYIADVDGKKVKDILVVHHKLFALFDHTLVVYDLMTRNFGLPHATKPVSQERVPNT